MSEVIEIPTYLVGPDEIVLRLTPYQYEEINASLKLMRERRDATRNYRARKDGKEHRANKISYKLGQPITQ